MTEPGSFCPKLAAASELLPHLRRHLEAAAARSTAGIAIGVMAVVDDALFGYELLPDGDADTWLVLGCNALGQATLRTTAYRPGALHLVARDGRRVTHDERSARHRATARDCPFPTWQAACDAAMARLALLFPHRPLAHPTIRECVGGLERALAVASLHLARWDPFIQFYGLPIEEQAGYALRGADGARGKLAFSQRSAWTLSWSAPPDALSLSWPARAGGAQVPYNRRDADRAGADRRDRRRYAAGGTGTASPWTGEERRHGHGRRAMDRVDR